MRKKWIVFLPIIMAFLLSIPVKANNEPFVMHTTAYCQGTITASGAKVRRGICAVKREWIGKLAIVYECKDG